MMRRTAFTSWVNLKLPDDEQSGDGCRRCPFGQAAHDQLAGSLVASDIREKDFSDLGKTSGLWWPAHHGEAHSPNGYRPEEVAGERDGTFVSPDRGAWGDSITDHRTWPAAWLAFASLLSPTAGLVSALAHERPLHGGANQGDHGDVRSGGFREYYLIGDHDESDDTDDGAADDRRELTEEYDPPHSPFGQIYMLIKDGVFTYRQIMWEIPWCVVLTMINDQGRMRKKKEEKRLMTEEEELDFLGLK